MRRTAPIRKRAAAKSAKVPLPTQAYLKPNDFRRHLLEKSIIIAPGDIESLLAQEEQIRAKIARDCGERDLLRRQLLLAVELLRDHVNERSPQIPYHTISVLAAAVLYFMDPIDVIPDFIRDVGTSDDALVIALAVEMVWPGIERYCIWKGKPLDGLRSTQKTTRRTVR